MLRQREREVDAKQTEEKPTAGRLNDDNAQIELPLFFLHLPTLFLSHQVHRRVDYVHTVLVDSDCEEQAKGEAPAASNKTSKSEMTRPRPISLFQPPSFAQPPPPTTTNSPPNKTILQSKHVGTGHADTSRFEWAVSMHRDTAAALAGHAHLTNYLAGATNEHPARVRAGLLAGMLLPCGLPPAPQGAAGADVDDEDGAAAAAAKKKKAAKKRKK